MASKDIQIILTLQKFLVSHRFQEWITKRQVLWQKHRTEVSRRYFFP